MENPIKINGIRFENGKLIIDVPDMSIELIFQCPDYHHEFYHELENVLLIMAHNYALGQEGHTGYIRIFSNTIQILFEDIDIEILFPTANGD